MVAFEIGEVVGQEAEWAGGVGVVGECGVDWMPTGPGEGDTVCLRVDSDSLLYVCEWFYDRYG